MSTMMKVKQMSHLRQKQISDNSCKAIIIDTLLEAIQPLSKSELSDEITSIFHVLVSPQRLNQFIDLLAKEGVILFDSEDHISIEPTQKAEFIIARLAEDSLRKQATLIWIDYIRTFQDISDELNECLSQALPIFLRSLFVRHGVSSYELLSSTNERISFDLKEISYTVSQQFKESIRQDVEDLLPTIFQVSNEAKIVEYLKHSIDKAIGYISEVISDENMENLTEELRNLTVYLDTNTVYRLLNLQGTSRYEAVKETLDFCRSNGVKLKISALTKKELSSRLRYDAKVLIQFPIPANLAQAGYRYRTSDNYVSTYWARAKTSKLSVEDYIEYYKNFDVLLEAEQIETEEIEVDEEALIEKARYYFGKMSLRDPLHEKSDYGLWHDAYNFAYIQKMQKADAKNAVDTRCLFLTTDQSLMSFQREDHEVKDLPPIVIAPSQLLQMFAFSRVDGGYEETFIKFFASSSLGITFKYNNNDIQEILSRVSHYRGVDEKIAEKILARQLVNSRYLNASTDEEKEEIIYNSISEELLQELNLTRGQITALESEKTQLDSDCKAALELLTENEEQFSKERQKLKDAADKAKRNWEEEAYARLQAEESVRNTQKYSNAQEELYVKEELQRWEKSHRSIFFLGLFLTGIVIVLSIFLWQHFDDSGCLSLLGLLTVTVIAMTIGGKVFSTSEKSEAEKQIREDYHKKLKERKF